LLKKIMTFTLLLALGIFTAGNALYAAECIYVPKATPENPDPELSPQGQCGVLIDRDTFKLNNNTIGKLDFSDRGLASIIYGDRIFYVSKQGKVARTIFFDNGADYFVEGMARTMANGKIGYIDDKLDVVIRPQYDFAFPFNNGVAIVCNACKSELVGEHRVVTGGQWGVINKAGKVVVPLKYDHNGLLEDADYKRIVKGD